MAERTAFFVHSRVLILQFCFFAGLSLALLTLDNLGYLKPVRSVLATLAYPLQVTVGVPVSAAQWVSRLMANHQRLLNEQSQLQHDNQQLRAQLHELRALKRENQRLRKLLQASNRLQTDAQVAEVMPVGLTPFSRKLKVNQGAYSGVTEGAPVMDAAGILGQVIQVEALSSTIMLITDPGHILPVEIQRNNLQTLAQGNGISGDLVLLYLQNTADIQVNDELVTSGQGGKFPEGYPVGIVTEIKRDISRTYLEARARPLASMERSREVFLLSRPADNDS